MGLTTAGGNGILDTLYRTTTWYIGLIRDDGYTALAAADTLASHAGWQEADEYAGDRKAFTASVAASKSNNNTGNEASFTINADQTFKGILIASAASGTVGTLRATVLFTGGDAACSNGDTLEVALSNTVA